MNFRNVLLAVTVLTGGSCFAETGDDLMSWVIGDWVARDGAVTEQWRAVSDDTLEGKGVMTAENHVSTEYMRLVNMAGEIFFIAKVAHNDLPVAFKLSAESAPERAVFTNPDHDFPKQIVYQKMGSDGMVVTVSDGTSKGFELQFTRRHIKAP